MDTRLHHLRCQLHLKPVWHNDSPEIIVTFNDNIIYSGRLYQSTVLNIDQHLPDNDYVLSVEFTNKHDSDTDIANNLDKAVIIENIVFNDISSPKFVWAGEYRPQYPEPWASEQQNLSPVLTSHNYLSWNGKWTLTFSMPIFTWIHKIEDFGWIYD